MSTLLFLPTDSTIDARPAIADAVAFALSETYPDTTTEQSSTTSGCPIIKFTVSGRVFNLTITRARRP